MRTLNVFKLARNADFNIKIPSSSANNNSNNSRPAKNYNFPEEDYGNETDADVDTYADGSLSDSGWQSSISSTTISGIGIGTGTGKSKSKKATRTKYTSQAKYTPVDPDSMMASPVRTTAQSSSANIVSIRNVHMDLNPVVLNINNENVNVNVHVNGIDNVNVNANANANDHYPPMNGLNGGPAAGGPRLQLNRNGNANQNGPGNGNALIHDVDPELYKRLINEAPFLTTAKEPPLQPSPSIDVTDGGGDSPCSETGTMSSASITVPLGSGTLATSRSTSVSKTDSSVSMSLAYDIDLGWVDPKLIKQGRGFIRRNFLSLMFAHFIGIAFLLAVRPVASILLRHGKFHKPAKRHNWHMYLLLLRRLKSWYDKGDLTDIDDPTTMDILKLRRSIWKAGKNFRKFLPPPAQDLLLTPEESKLLEATKDDLNEAKANDQGLLKDVSMDTKNIPKIFATCNPDIPWSQYDLAVTQFAFFGFVSLFPRSFGIHNENGDGRGLKGFIHLWAVLGHLLGLENQFNLCHPNNFDEETNRKILKHVFLFSFKIGDNGMFRMMQLLSKGVTWFTIFMTRLRLVLIFMTREIAQVHSTKNLYGQVKWYDRLDYFLYKFWLKWLVRIFFLRMLANLLARFVLQVAYGLYFAQMQWKHWRARRKTPQPVIYPSSISLSLSKA